MTPGWSDAKNLLCICLDEVGGLLVSTPALRALKDAVPGRRITLLADPRAARAARHVPEVDELLPYDAPWMRGGVAPDGVPDLAIRYLLAMRNFDAAAIFTRPGEAASPLAVLCRLAGIPLRLAYGHGGASSPLTHAVREFDGVPGRHAVQRQLDLVSMVGARTVHERLSFRVGSRAQWCARMKLEEAGLDVARPYLLVEPAAPGAARGWPAERFGAAAGELATILDAQVVVTGDAGERGLADAVRREAGHRARSLAGSLTLEERAAAVDAAALALCHEGAVAHLAAAVGTPVVGLYAAEQLARAPWKVIHRVLPLDAATVPQVVAAACDLWLDIHWRAAA